MNRILILCTVLSFTNTYWLIDANITGTGTVWKDRGLCRVDKITINYRTFIIELVLLLYILCETQGTEPYSTVIEACFFY